MKALKWLTRGISAALLALLVFGADDMMDKLGPGRFLGLALIACAIWGLTCFVGRIPPNKKDGRYTGRWL